MRSGMSPEGRTPPAWWSACVSRPQVCRATPSVAQARSHRVTGARDRQRLKQKRRVLLRQVRVRTATAHFFPAHSLQGAQQAASVYLQRWHLACSNRRQPRSFSTLRNGKHPIPTDGRRLASRLALYARFPPLGRSWTPVEHGVHAPVHRSDSGVVRGLSEKEFEMAKSNKKGGTSGSSQTGKSKRKGK
jgi:hypothetical protein